MFDIKWIRENPDDFDKAMARRGLGPQAAALIDLDAKRRDLVTAAQEIQAERNKLSKEVGALKARGDDSGDLIAKVSKSKDAEAEAEKEAAAASEALDAAMAELPNLPAVDVPDGPDETANKEIRTWGDQPTFDFEPREHFHIGEGLGLMDFETAARMSGARFVLLTGALAHMERALANFMLDLHTTEHDLIEVNPPALVNDDAMFATGQLPKFEGDLFAVESVDWEYIEELVNDRLADHQRIMGEELGEEQREWRVEEWKSEYAAGGKLRNRLWLIPTAEVPLTNIVADQIIEADYLPRRYAAMTWCFRSEAGAAGKDTRGMIRQHQFTKVEMVTVCTPETSPDELKRMTDCAEEVLKRLGLPYRTVVLSTGDMGFGAQKTHDIEVWLPGQDKYREISSCSNCGDFQARRMNARFKVKGEKQTRFVHTLNGSGLAVGRTLIAILENFQQADGSVVVPESLRSYMGGLEVISADGG